MASDPRTTQGAGATSGSASLALPSTVAPPTASSAALANVHPDPSISALQVGNVTPQAPLGFTATTANGRSRYADASTMSTGRKGSAQPAPEAGLADLVLGAVPEPGIFAVVVIASCGVLARRREERGTQGLRPR